MSKMHLPELDVIRFSTEDVIATSANRKLGISLSPNQWYVTIGSELNEDPAISGYGGTNKYGFQYINNAVSNIKRLRDAETEGAFYAWYHKDQWRTGADLEYDYKKDSLQFLTDFDFYYTN